MPIPVIVAKLVAAAPKIIAIGSAVKGLGAGAKKAREEQNAKNMADLKARLQATTQEYMSLSPEEKQAWRDRQNPSTKQKMLNSDEQINDTTTSSEKSFLGLQTVEAGKKQQTKIIMIAGGILLLLFFFMKKK
jgi:hypothetical protein